MGKGLEIAWVADPLEFFFLQVQGSGRLRAPDGSVMRIGYAGQNGLRSVTAALGPDYRRVRIGIGHPGEKSRVTGHVLQNFSKNDLEWFKPMLDAMVEAAPLLAKDDDVGFMSKVALLTAPPKPEKAKPEKPAKPKLED